MEKLDRLGWADGLAVRCHGVRIGIRTSVRGRLKAIRKVLPPGWKPVRSRSRPPGVDHLYSVRIGGGTPGSRIRRFHLLYADSARLSRSLDFDEVLRALELALGFVVSLEARNRLFIHAGVVAWKNQAILIPGQSFSGKSTLVDALVTAGAIYYSDEFAVIDPRGRVHPYPTPIALRDGSHRPVGERGHRVISGRDLPPLRIGAVIACPYRKGASWNARRLSASRAVLALLAHTVVARIRPRFALATLRNALVEASAFAGVRGEAVEAAESILARLDKRRRAA